MATDVNSRDVTAARSTAVTVVLLVVASLLLLILTLGWLFNVHRILTGEVKIVPKEHGSIQREYGSLHTVVGNYSLEKQVPPDSLAEMLNGREEPGMRMLREGIDPWGTPFIFRRQTMTSEDGTIDFIVTIRSAGPNRIDEQGKGDDIERVMRGLVQGTP